MLRRSIAPPSLAGQQPCARVGCDRRRRAGLAGTADLPRLRTHGSGPRRDPPAEHVAAASCYGLYARLLARDYSDPDYYRVAHQLVGDAYAAQHAGGTSRRPSSICSMSLTSSWLEVSTSTSGWSVSGPVQVWQA